MNRIWLILKSVWTIAISLTTLVFAFAPESIFTHGFITVDFSTEWLIICNRLWFLLALSILTFTGIVICRAISKKATINGANYKIVVEYGNIFDKSDCLKVINFDECYTTHIGTAPADIKSWSICGQFLTKYPDVDFKAIVEQYGAKLSRKHSEYNNKECYPSGTIVPYDEFLLLAFTKLDKDGLGRMSREEFLLCLDLLWKEIDKYHTDKSVAIPILGSGITRFHDELLSQQQLLDMIIASYKLSPYKMKSSSVLYIVCRKADGFSINKIGEYI